jgi:hypothetical protein
LKSFVFDSEGYDDSEQFLMRCWTRCAVLSLVALLLEVGTSVGQAAAPAVTNQSPVLPDFNYAQGWLGADDAYSVALDPHKSLWLFGDTFVGSKATAQRSQAKTMVRNSIGISHCVPHKRCAMRYFWSQPKAPKPRSFFDSGTDDLWYWPLDGFLNGKTLYVALLAVRNKPNATPKDIFGFEIVGTKLATISNVHASPAKWRPVVRDLSDSQLWVGVSIVRDGNYLIWYTQVIHGEGSGYISAMRTLANRIATSPTAWEYLRNDGQWKAGFPSEDAMHLIDQPISEMSVRFHPSTHKWVALSIGPEFPSPRAVVRLSESPLGPWSAPQTLFEFPEVKASAPGFDRDTFCYAVKEHTEFMVNKIALTYACNSMVVDKVMANMQIYRPRVVVLDLPK